MTTSTAAAGAIHAPQRPFDFWAMVFGHQLKLPGKASLVTHKPL
jgi:hypothetical protein